MGVFKKIEETGTPAGGGVFTQVAAQPPPRSPQSGTGWEQKIPVLKQFSNLGLGIGSALGKAVLKAPEALLRAGAGVGSLVGDKKGAANLSAKADLVKGYAEELYQKPFQTELETLSGKAGTVVGTIAPYFAGAGIARTASLFPRVAARTAVDTGIASAQSGGDWKTMGATGVTSAIANAIPIPGKGIFARMAAGAIPGYTADVASGVAGLRGEERTGGNAFIPGAGTAIGLGLGAAPSAISAVSRVTNRKTPEVIIPKRMKGLQQLEDNNAPVRRVIEKHAQKGIDSKKLLAETDLLHNSVDETGTIRTKNAMDELNTFLKEGPETVVNKNLEREGVMITLNSLRKTLKDAVSASGLQGRALTSALKAVDDDIAGYALRADPQGRVPLALVHAAKVDKYANINYMVPESARGDKVIARALKETVERNTKSVDVQALNKELQAHYSVLDLLEKLDGRKVAGARLGKYFAQTVGAVVGSHFGPLGAIVGAELGGRVRGGIMQRTFQGVTGKDVRSSASMKEAIAKGDSPRVGILPAPGGRRVVNNMPIIMRPPYSQEAQSPQINRTTNPLPQSSKSTGSLNQAQTKNIPKQNSQNIPKSTTEKGGLPGRATVGALAAGALGGAVFAGGATGDTTKAELTQALPVAQAQAPQETKKAPLPKGVYTFPDRDVQVTEKDLSELRKILFSEISNRSKDKQLLEARVITNTAINRTKQRGSSLTKELTRPQQYQGYNTREYKRLARGEITASDRRKLEAIDEIIDLIRQGKLRDNLDGGTFYYHHDNGAIVASKEFAF